MVKLVLGTLLTYDDMSMAISLRHLLSGPIEQICVIILAVGNR